MNCCRKIPILAWTAGLLLALSGAARGQQLLSSDHHPWASFPVNSWKLVRTTSESLDAKGKPVSVTITETRTTLIALDESSYTLRSEAIVDVAGRRIASTPHIVRHGFVGEVPGQSFTVKRLGEASLTIDRRVIPCELQQVTVEDNNGKLTSLIHYAPDVAPYVLRRETTRDVGGEEKRDTSLVEVIALDLPHRVRGDLKEGAYIKTTQKTPTGTKVTLEVHCEDLPGGVAAHWASETDASGKAIRRSTLELLGYGLPIAATEATGMLPRRSHRAAKQARRMEAR